MDIEIVNLDQVPPMPKERYRGPAAYTRHKRFNARGDVWCNYCQQYLPAHRFRFVSFPSLPKPKYWSYCKECTRLKDQERYRQSTSTLASAEQVLAKRYERKKRLQTKVRSERVQFIDDAIHLLRLRGFTYADICKLMGCANGTLIQWRKHIGLPTLNTERRFGCILLATSHIPAGDAPASYRRLPNPHLPGLIQQLAPELAKYPLRNGWINGRRNRNADPPP